MSYTVYLLRCADDTIYTGIALDADDRAYRHNLGSGAKYTRSRRPVLIVYRERCEDHGAALRRELELKKLRRADKEALISLYAERVRPVFEQTKLDLSDFMEMQALERRCYAEAFITPAAEAYQWYRLAPDSVTAFYSESGLAGFVNLFPVSDRIYARLAAGTLNDSELRAEDLLDPGQSFFLSCIAATEAYRGTGLILMMLKAAAARYAERVPGSGRILLDAATPGGESLALRLHLRFLRESEHGTRLFEGRYRSFYRFIMSRAPSNPL